MTAGWHFQYIKEWMPELGIRYHVALDGISLWLVLLTTFITPIAAIRVVRQRSRRAEGALLRLPVAGGGHVRRVRLARPLHVLRVLGGHAPADVLPHRHLGRPEAAVRGDQVLPLHARRQRLHARGDRVHRLDATRASRAPSSFDYLALLAQ
jgi:hypothetical protein